MAAGLFSRLSTTESPVPWGLLFAFNSIIVAYIMILMGTFVGAYFIGPTALGLLVGWIIGCPLLGFISDRIGRRKPVIAAAALALFACLAWILYGPPDVFPPYVLGIVAGIVSGAAMVPYTVIKEANPPEMSGTATGVINFINFTFSALLGPLFARLLVSAGGGTGPDALGQYQIAFDPLLYGVVLAIGLTFLLRETGPAARQPLPLMASA